VILSYAATREADLQSAVSVIRTMDIRP